MIKIAWYQIPYCLTYFLSSFVENVVLLPIVSREISRPTTTYVISLHEEDNSTWKDGRRSAERVMRDSGQPWMVRIIRQRRTCDFEMLTFVIVKEEICLLQNIKEWSMLGGIEFPFYHWLKTRACESPIQREKPGYFWTLIWWSNVYRFLRNPVTQEYSTQPKCWSNLTTTNTTFSRTNEFKNEHTP